MDSMSREPRGGRVLGVIQEIVDYIREALALWGAENQVPGGLLGSKCSALHPYDTHLATGIAKLALSHQLAGTAYSTMAKAPYKVILRTSARAPR